MKSTIHLLLILFILPACSSVDKFDNKNTTVLPVSKVNWEKLNPARGDKSPQAGTLWGDRKGEVETAFLAKFVDGFSSPPHIHNVSYRAIVIDGLIHNDDPKAAKMWMPASSYWTQPAGEAHITSAKGKSNIAFVEIDKGPYLVKPVKQSFNNGEHPFNIHASNIIWAKYGRASIVPLWKNSEEKVIGSLLKYKDKIDLSSKEAQIVVISGEIKANKEPKTVLKPGSLITLKDSKASIWCMNKSDCIVYVKSEKGFEF